jgi:hypothetical protein
MSCPCDSFVFPRALDIPAGLGAHPFRIARALGIFADWRLATLDAIGAEPALDAWRTRAPRDLGLMLAELGAYVFDVTSFHDALVAGETFLKTAQLSGAQRRLVALLGYLARPAVAAQAYLAAEADGQRVVTLPAGVAFRSGDFDGNPPQTFELTQPRSIDPRANRFTVDRVLQDAITASTLGSVLVDPGSVRVRAGHAIVLDFSGTLRPTRMTGVTPVALRSRTPASRLTFSPAVAVPAGATYSSLRILAGGSTTGLWKLGEIDGEVETAISQKDILLETLVALRAGELVLFEKGGALEARRVESTIERQRTILASLTSTIKDRNDAVLGTVVSPAIKKPITRLSLDATLTFTSADATQIVIHYPLTPAARVLVPAKDTLAHDDPIAVRGLTDAPRVTIERLALEDEHTEGVVTRGSLDAEAREARLAQGEGWDKTLGAAVTLFGNVLEVSRGESVHGEELGIGDGAVARPTFKLKKKPLTYLNAPTTSGRKSTLAVRVGGILWLEVETFFGATDADRVYIVRHDEQGETFVTFGGGARLATGARVTADYRFGAGAAVPPAGSISQLAKPVPGLRAVKNVLPAFGGADAESPREITTYGPRSALLLGRAISLPDIEAAAATVPGVRAARADWRWDERDLRPAAQVLYIGSEQFAPVLRARLRALMEPDAPLAVVRSLPQPATLAIDVDVHGDFVPEDVIAALREALYAKADLPDTGGPLRPERLGPEGVVFLSRVVAVVERVAGVAGVRAVSFDGSLFVDVARQPAPGHYFDFGEPGTPSSRLRINGVA